MPIPVKPGVRTEPVGSIVGKHPTMGNRGDSAAAPLTSPEAGGRASGEGLSGRAAVCSEAGGGRGGEDHEDSLSTAANRVRGPSASACAGEVASRVDDWADGNGDGVGPPASGRELGDAAAARDCTCEG